MTVESKILENSKEKIKALAPRAAKAAKNPDTGVKIIVKGAYYVIRDCAQITVDYLPLKLYGCYDDPIIRLAGLFTKKEIQTLVTNAKTNTTLQQLCSLMLVDAKKKIVVKPEPPIDLPDEPDVDDVYGDYGSDSYDEEELKEKVKPEEESFVVKILCEAFKVK